MRPVISTVLQQLICDEGVVCAASHVKGCVSFIVFRLHRNAIKNKNKNKNQQPGVERENEWKDVRA